RLREDLVEITLITGDRGAIGEGDSHRRDFGGRSRWLDEGGAEIEEMRPFPWVLGAGCLSVEAIDKGISTIPKQSAFRNLSAVQLLAHHRLHGISPERRHSTKLNLPCVRHSPHSLNGYPLRAPFRNQSPVFKKSASDARLFLTTHSPDSVGRFDASQPLIPADMTCTLP